MNTKIFDSHSHYDASQFNEDRSKLLDQLFSRNVGKIMTCADCIESAIKCRDLAEKYENIYASAGIHPENAVNTPENYIQKLEEIIKSSNKFKAVGEIGLDYHYDIPKDIQTEVFIRQLCLAKKLGLPVIMHDREAHGDMMSIVKKYQPKGVMHCFSGSCEDAKILCKMGIYIGFTGVITFSNARKTREVAAEIPLELMLIETDAPYLAPTPNRGKRNRSDYLTFVAEEIAKIRGIPSQEVIKITHDNACRLFNI